MTETGARHITPSCVVCMPHMKWFVQITRKSRSRHGKKFNWPVRTFLPFVLKTVRDTSPLMCCMHATYEVIRSNKAEAIERTRQKRQMTRVTLISNDRWDLDLWPVGLVMDRDTSWTIFMPSIKRIRQIGTYPQYDFRCLKWHSFRLQELQISNETLQWRHNGWDSVSNHQPHDGLLNRLFRCISKKTSKLRVTVFCAGN